jgi:putative phosphoesterase
MKLGFIADIHGHIEALQIALNVLAAHHVDSICFLGDAVGYLPGSGAIPIIQQTCSVCVRGNHEAMLLKPDDVPENRDAIYQLRTTSREAGASEILNTIECWPDRETITAYSSRLLLVHGSPAEPLTGYVYPDTPLKEWNNLDYTHVVCAHTHRPFQRACAGVTWLNCGSVGLPRDDGRYGSAAVLDLETQKAQILRFDITHATRRALRRVGHVAEEVRAVYERRSTENLEGTVVG